MMPGPLRYRFRVGCPAERAFELWTESAGVWWPMATHSVSGRGDSVLVIEPGPGGGIYEQTAGGRQFSWGTVVAWEPPRRLVCEWLVGDTPTELEVRFAPGADGGTVVQIEHRGWERFSIAPVAGGMSRGWAELAGIRLKGPVETATRAGIDPDQLHTIRSIRLESDRGRATQSGLFDLRDSS